MSIGYGDLVICAIDVIGDIDVFRFSGASGEAIAAQLVMLSGAVPALELWRPDGSLFAKSEPSFGTTARIDALLDQSGTWTLLARERLNDETAPYHLALERVAPPSVGAVPLCMSHLLADAIDPFGDLDVFGFSGESGQAVVAQLVMLSGAVPGLELWRPDGSLFAKSEPSFGATARIDALLDQSGTWTLLARERLNDETALYHLILERISPCLLPVSDVTLSNQSITSPQIVEACGSVHLGPLVTVSPPGELGACAGGSVIVDDDVEIEAGAAFFAGAPALGTAIGFGSLVDDRIDPFGDVDSFRFSGESGQAVVAQLVMLSGAVPALELWRPDGSLVAKSEPSFGTTARIDALLDQSGTWTLLARERLNDETAAYSVTLECVAGCP